MTPQERQELSQKLRSEFDTAVFQFEGKPGDKIPFEFNYHGTDLAISCIQPGCGCTEAILKGNKITGYLQLDPVEKYSANQKSVFVSKAISVYFIDNQEWFEVNEKGNRVNNPNKIHASVNIQGNVILA